MTDEILDEIRDDNVRKVGCMMLLGWTDNAIRIAGYSDGAIREARSQARYTAPEAPDPSLPDNVIEGEDRYLRIDD